MTTNGLEGIIAAETVLSDVDGERGELVLRGARVENLAGHEDFEAATHFFASGEMPSDAEAERVRALMAEGRALAFERLARLGDALDASDAMSGLRAMVGHLTEADTGADEREAAARLSGALMLFSAAWACRREQRALLPPDASLGAAADALRLIRGRIPLAAEAAALDAYLVTVMDHGMNASTFTARVIASTGSDLVSAVTGGIGALKGPLHGGAPGPVLDMLDAIGSTERAEAWLRTELGARRRIMGMGHRIYRVRDPRAFVLERAIEALERELDERRVTTRLALARAVERNAERLLAERHPDRPLRANVEFYTAVLLEAVGIPRALFTAIFAASRVVGWSLHVAEQRRTGRLIRPASRYVGPPPATA